VFNKYIRTFKQKRKFEFVISVLQTTMFYSYKQCHILSAVLRVLLDIEL